MSNQKPPSFRAFTAAKKALSPVLHTEVRIGAGFDPKELASGAAPPYKTFLALWDTGATGSAITQKVVDECGLKPTGMTIVHHAQGQDNAETYLVSIALPNKVAFPQVRVAKGVMCDVDALIGMDIITQGDLAITNYAGKTVFSFRVPSIRCIDFVQEAKELNVADGIGRNEPCPCGSGKKFKNCCGK